MILPNKDSNAKKLDPIEAFYDIVKAAKMGDLLEIEQTKISNKPAIRGLKTYTMKPGEDEPNVFVYGGVSSKGDQTVITLTKFLQPATLAIASKKDAAGKMTPDADLMTAVNAFKDGDSVEVQTAGQNLKSIKAYVAPRKVEFVKVLRQQKVGDKEYTGIEVKDNTVLLVNPRTSAPVLDKLGTLKAGESYLVKTTNEGGTEWLTDIKPAPKEEAPKDAPKDAPKK